MIPPAATHRVRVEGSGTALGPTKFTVYGCVAGPISVTTVYVPPVYSPGGSVDVMFTSNSGPVNVFPAAISSSIVAAFNVPPTSGVDPRYEFSNRSAVGVRDGAVGVIMPGKSMVVVPTEGLTTVGLGSSSVSVMPAPALPADPISNPSTVAVKPIDLKNRCMPPPWDDAKC